MTWHRGDPISGNYRRRIASTLVLLDETLCRFEHWAKGNHAAGVLYREGNTLAAEARQAILSEIAAIRNALAELRDEFALEAKIQDVSHAIWSAKAICWASLVELETRYLRGYGTPPDGFPEYFDPKVGQIIEHLDRIGEAVDPHRRDRRSDD